MMINFCQPKSSSSHVWGIEVCKYAIVLVIMNKFIQSRKYTHMHVNNCASINVWNYTGIKLCKYPSKQGSLYASMLVYKYEIMEVF